MGVASIVTTAAVGIVTETKAVGLALAWGKPVAVAVASNRVAVGKMTAVDVAVASPDGDDDTCCVGVADGNGDVVGEGPAVGTVWNNSAPHVAPEGINTLIIKIEIKISNDFRWTCCIVL